MALLPGHQSKNLYVPGGWIENSSQHLYRGGFASAIWPDKGEHLTLFKRKANVLHGLTLTIAWSHKRTQATCQPSCPFTLPKRLRQPINLNDRHRNPLLCEHRKLFDRC